MVSELRPRGIGEILDSAVVLYRARFTKLVPVAACVVVPVQILTALVLLSAQPDHFTLNVTGTVSPQYDSSSVPLQLGAIVVITIVSVLSTALVGISAAIGRSHPEFLLEGIVVAKQARV